MSFLQDGVDNVELNRKLEFRFSEAILASSVDTSSIQIRRGDQFGASVPGTFRVEGSTICFEPQLPGLCDLSDAAFDADTQYRVQLIGFPEEFAIRNTRGQPLKATETFEFHTREENDPERFADQIPAFGPEVVPADSSPSDGDIAVAVNDTNRIVLRLTENLDPCTVNLDSVIFEIYETGDRDIGTNVQYEGRNSGFYSPSGDPADQSANPFTWGVPLVATPMTPPQRVIANIVLDQDFSKTEIIITPTFGQFPENSLLVVRLTSEIEDFGGQPLTPFTMSFTTENQPEQTGEYVILAEGETPFQSDESTADINTARAPSKIQGYLLFAGDGDNGSILDLPSGPFGDGGTPCTNLQGNDGTKDPFEPDDDFVFDTGATINACTNQTDGSTAVVYEFSTFRVGSGVTVRVVGVNPAIFLIDGDVVIESGGRLLLRGDGSTGVPNGRGGAGNTGANGNPVLASKAGVGVAGGEDGGASFVINGNHPPVGEHGVAGFGTGSFGVRGGLGAGEGNVEVRRSSWGGGAGSSAAAGGGGGHATAGEDGQAVENKTPTSYPVPAEGAGGGTYPTGDTKLLQPSAGSGGGAGGAANYTNSSAAFYNGSGGAGGAGGGFVDLTSAGNISVFGSIDAAGGAGGSGVIPNNVANWFNSAGGGGGSGGGIRLLTPNEINVSGGTLSAAGGSAGPTPVAAPGGPANLAGAGGNGRLVMEDADSIITGLGTATVSPAEGGTGFFRSSFDATRFQGGGTMPQAVSDIIAMGPLLPNYEVPVAGDFAVGIPAITARSGGTGIFIEARGYKLLPDGQPDEDNPSFWRTIGYFTDSGDETNPTWHPSANPPSADVAVPGDNMGGSINDLDGFEFLQFRITFYLPGTVGPFDQGPFIDTWSVKFKHDL